MAIKSKKKSVKKTSTKTSKSKRTKILCISHMEDADGISSAALIKQAFGGDTILVDYPGMIDVLETLLPTQISRLLSNCTRNDKINRVLLTKALGKLKN